MSSWNSFKPCAVKERLDGSVVISFGDPRKGPHYQTDFGDDIELGQAVADAFNAHDFDAPSKAKKAEAVAL